MDDKERAEYNDYKEPPRVVQITFTHETLGDYLRFAPYMDEAYSEWRKKLDDAPTGRDGFSAMSDMDSYLASNGVRIDVAVPDAAKTATVPGPLPTTAATYTPPAEMAPFLSYQHELGYSKGVKDVLTGLREFSMLSFEEREALTAIPPSQGEAENG